MKLSADTAATNTKSDNFFIFSFRYTSYLSAMANIPPLLYWEDPAKSAAVFVPVFAFLMAVQYNSLILGIYSMSV